MIRFYNPGESKLLAHQSNLAVNEVVLESPRQRITYYLLQATSWLLLVSNIQGPNFLFNLSYIIYLTLLIWR